jgi:hypothetical protein
VSPGHALLGHIKLFDLTTAEIRAWHRQLTEHSGATGNVVPLASQRART